MEEKSELNDIILNKGGSANNNKKVILAVATLGIILIVVILIMNTISSDGTDNLPQAAVQPQQLTQPQQQTDTSVVATQQDDAYFEEVEIEDNGDAGETIEQVTQRLKEQSKKEETAVAKKETKQKVVTKVKKVTTKTVAKVQKAQPKKQTAKSTNGYYVQVGAFVRVAPNKKFLNSITNKGFAYKYHKVTRDNKTLNKVLVGPFKNEKEARGALKVIRNSIEHGAFIVHL